MKAGFVNIFGKPNAGKSTLMNALMGEKLAIVSPKVQTTRHRIKGIITEPGFQIVFSDTPGIIDPRYKLHEKMMMAVKSALEDADIALLIADVESDPKEEIGLFSSLQLKAKTILILNKIDKLKDGNLEEVIETYKNSGIASDIIPVSAIQGINLDTLLKKIVEYLPESEPFYTGDDLSDLPTKFFVGELIREKIYELYEEEIPYHTAVVVSEFKEKATLIKIRAEIIVQRESQKAIIIGEKGRSIKQLGTISREEIEKFLGQKVFLELFVKVRPKWRDNEQMLREYGYH
jgi:GTP-binding protein Era